jgi:Spore Coat Protein U domain
MKKLLASTIAVALLAMSVSAVQAATLGPATFNVTASLSAACSITSVGTPTIAFGTYTAFQATALNATSPITIQCTRSLAAPTFAFDGATGYGVLAGLNYNVTAASAITTVGTAATAVAGGIGTADVRTITLTGSMAAGQAGTCAGATATACAATQTAVRTITITY